MNPTETSMTTTPMPLVHRLPVAAALALLLGLASVAPARAQAPADEHAQHHPAAAAPAANADAMTDGEIRKVDKGNGKLTIRHGEIRNLDMPGMTMVFVAQPPTLLDKVKVGDKVKFHAEKIEGGYAVTAIEPQR